METWNIPLWPKPATLGTLMKVLGGQSIRGPGALACPGAQDGLGQGGTKAQLRFNKIRSFFRFFTKMELGASR